MTEKTLPLRATLKSGTGYDAPWLTIDAADPSDLEFKLNALLEGSAVKAIVEVAELFKAANTLAPVVAPQAPAPAQEQPAGWSNSPDPAPSWGAGQQQAPQQAAPPQQQGGGFRPRGQVHPEGRTCEICPNPLELKKTTTGKPKWSCPDWRWNNGTPNGHTTEWIN